MNEKITEREKFIKRLKESEFKIRKEIDKVDNELKTMRNLCTSNDMDRIWRNSKDYAVLYAKLEVLEKALFEIMDIRYDIVRDKEI